MTRSSPLCWPCATLPHACRATRRWHFIVCRRLARPMRSFSTARWNPVSHQCLREARLGSYACCYYGDASRWMPLAQADEHAGCGQWVVSCGSRQVPTGMPAKPSVVVSVASSQAPKARAPVWAMSTGRSVPSSPGPALSDVPVAAILAQLARQRAHSSSRSARGDRRRSPARIAGGRWRARLFADHPHASGFAHVASALRPSRHGDPHDRSCEFAPRSRPGMRRCRPTSPPTSPSVEPLEAKGSTQAPRGSVANSFLVRTPSGELCLLWPRLGHGARAPPASYIFDPVNRSSKARSKSSSPDATS